MMKLLYPQLYSYKFIFFIFMNFSFILNVIRYKAIDYALYEYLHLLISDDIQFNSLYPTILRVEKFNPFIRFNFIIFCLFIKLHILFKF